MSETVDRQQVVRDFKDAVNMSAAALKTWLATAHSREVGDSHAPGGEGGESTGHRSGRKIIDLLGKREAEFGDADLAHMRKVTGYVHRHLAQRPDGDISATKWRYSLMNWGHDPLR